MPPYLLTTMPLAMIAPLLALANLWYAVPLIVSVSLVCSATRHEEINQIVMNAVRFGVWIVVFMSVVMLFLTLLSMLA